MDEDVNMNDLELVLLAITASWLYQIAEKESE